MFNMSSVSWPVLTLEIDIIFLRIWKYLPRHLGSTLFFDFVNLHMQIYCTKMLTETIYMLKFFWNILNDRVVKYWYIHKHTKNKFIFTVRSQFCKKLCVCVYIPMYKYTEKRLDVLYSYVFYKFCSDYKQLVPYKNFKHNIEESPP